IQEERIRACLGSMRRRGPDHADYRHLRHGESHAYLLSTRLNIIDLGPRANQPFQVGAKTMSYNGELYNYLELRRELERCGERFTTESDTEVLLRYVARQGWPALDRGGGSGARPSSAGAAAPPPCGRTASAASRRPCCARA